jgi:hypothetical protein
MVWQTINIRVYHRQGRKETSGWFATKDKASLEFYSMQEDQSFTLFDGERLRIHFTDITDLKPFDLDVTFSANAQAWTGTWSRSGQAFSLVLERPSCPPQKVRLSFESSSLRSDRSPMEGLGLPILYISSSVKERP